MAAKVVDLKRVWRCCEKGCGRTLQYTQQIVVQGAFDQWHEGSVLLRRAAVAKGWSYGDSNTYCAEHRHNASVKAQRFNLSR